MGAPNLDLAAGLWRRCRSGGYSGRTRSGPCARPVPGYCHSGSGLHRPAPVTCVSRDRRARSSRAQVAPAAVSPLEGGGPPRRLLTGWGLVLVRGQQEPEDVPAAARVDRGGCRGGRKHRAHQNRPCLLGHQGAGCGRRDHGCTRVPVQDDGLRHLIVLRGCCRCPPGGPGRAGASRVMGPAPLHPVHRNPAHRRDRACFRGPNGNVLRGSLPALHRRGHRLDEGTGGTRWAAGWRL